MRAHACACSYACVWVCMCVVLMSVVQRSRAEGDSDGEVQGKMGEREMSGVERSGEVDNLVQSVVDDLREKKGEERDIIREQGGRESERGVVSGEKRRKIPLLERRSRLSAVSSRNASQQKWSHKLTAWKI